MNRRERRNQERRAKKSLAQHPTQAIEHYDLGVALQNQGKAEEAAERYRRALEIDPDLTDAHNNLGNILKGQGKLGQAIDCYRRTIEIDPNYQMAHYNLANVLQDRGKLDEAVACYHRALAMNPDNADVYNNLGNTLRAQRKPDEAMACYYRVLAIDPNHALAYHNLGNLFKDLKKLEGAIDCYRRALEINPDYPAALFNLGNVLKDKKELDEAIACYRRTIEILPGFAMAHFHLGEVFKKQGKLEQAIESYQRAIEIDPNHADAYNNLGNAFVDQEGMDRAYACFQRALEIDPDHAVARLNHARHHAFFPGDPHLEKLKALLKRKHLSTDKRNQLLFLLGKAHDDVGLYAEAFSYFSQGNEDKNKRMKKKFNPSIDQRATEAIQRAFPERSPSIREGSVGGAHVPIFITGMSRSGKSLVESLLSQHPDVYDAGEKHEWIEAVDKVRERHSISQRFPKCVDSLAGEHIREIGATYIQDMSKYAPKSPFIVNTLPGNYRHIGLIFQALPSAKVIYCHRDPLDHCLFVYFKRYAGNTNKNSYDMRDVASFYAVHRQLMAHWQRLYGERILSVRYEDVVRDTREAGARLFAYCGLDFDPAAIRHGFTTDEIGHWRNYEPYIGPLRDALGAMAQ